VQYRIKLEPPNYLSEELVKQHLVFSRIWGVLLKERLTSSSRASCNSIILPLIFPDLFAELFPNGRAATNVQCERELQSLLRGDVPATASTINASNKIVEELRGMPLQYVNVAAEYIFRKALREVYASGSVMHALMSVDAAAFEAADVGAFPEWLNKQIISKQPSIKELPNCEEKSSSAANVSNEYVDLPYSHVVQPGIIELHLARDEAPPILNRFLLLGVSNQKGIGGGMPLAAETFSVNQFCDRRQKFRVGEHSDDEKELQIMCLHAAPFGNPWVVFFCDPKDCTSAGDANSALKVIQQSIEAHDEARKLAGGREPQGPYLVEVHSLNN
jgi:predicted RNase H-like HicB family nuclease